MWFRHYNESIDCWLISSPTEPIAGKIYDKMATVYCPIVFTAFSRAVSRYMGVVMVCLACSEFSGVVLSCFMLSRRTSWAEESLIQPEHSLIPLFEANVYSRSWVKKVVNSKRSVGQEQAKLMPRRAYINRMLLKLPAFSLFRVLCPEGSTLAACLTGLSQSQFYTERFWVWVFIPIKGWAATLFSLCCRAVPVNHRLMSLSTFPKSSSTRIQPSSSSSVTIIIIISHHHHHHHHQSSSSSSVIMTINTIWNRHCLWVLIGKRVCIYIIHHHHQSSWILTQFETDIFYEFS